MKTQHFKFLIACVAIFISCSSNAKTNNPIDLSYGSGFTYTVDNVNKTQLFIDRDNQGIQAFWVKVFRAYTDPNTEQRFENTYIKSFPVSRYHEVRRVLRTITHWGSLNPYLDGFIICDAPNAMIRFRQQQLSLNYNCGGGGVDAEQQTLNAESLLQLLTSETVNSPDMNQELIIPLLEPEEEIIESVIAD